MIQLKSFLKVIDNSGALIVECINVIGGARQARVGDQIVCVVKKARPISEGTSGPGSSAASAAVSKLRKGEVLRALVVRTQKESIRRDGTVVKFDDNACVMLNKQGQPLGNRIMGVVANECRQKRWAKIISLAPKVV
ncbi:hypothetical protein HK102_007761 [Quaeritorhiza haematococci]|nr:hypothetical protein HK102_007761 [Quaeritorhiza haematococci]